MARPTQPVALGEDEKQALERLTLRARSARSLAFGARVVLACAQGKADVEVARQLRCHPQTVGSWRKRYLAGGIEALLDEPRPGAPRKISDEKVEQVVVATLESTPPAATQWSTRLMARKMGLNATAVSRIWRAFGLRPHRRDTFVLSKDPQLIEKVRDIVGLYLSPPANAMVLCVDEKSQIQALNRTQPLLPLRPGRAERATPDYERNGTTSLFAALDIATGHVIGRCFAQHTSSDFRDFLDLVDRQLPADPDLQIHLVLDNYSTHKTALIRDWLVKRPRYHLHFTPTHASWLNQVERWFAQRQTTHRLHRVLHDRAQPRSQTLPLGKIRRRNPRLHHPLRFVRTPSTFYEESMTQDTSAIQTTSPPAPSQSPARPALAVARSDS